MLVRPSNRCPKAPRPRLAARGLLQAIAALAPAAFVDAADPLLEVFPPSTCQIPAAERGDAALSSTFTPSGSLWADGLDERQVFRMELRHAQEPCNAFALRIGKGGQIYSLRGAFGESVPPSWRGEGKPRSPWNDEVWQCVAVCTRYNGLPALLRAGGVPEECAARFQGLPYAQSFFIHNSGAYIPGDAAVSSLYCPQLAESLPADGRTYRTLNWGLVPQVRTVHRSPILFYTQVRDLGDGVIELTWVVHNFSTREDVVFDWLNAPWGGTRVTSLPMQYVGSTNGLALPREQVCKGDAPVEVRKTGGWSLACVSDAPDSAGVAMVYGRDQHLEEEQARAAQGLPACQLAPSWFRDHRAHYPQLYEKAWRDWPTRPANSFRNYDVVEVIPRLRLAPGTTVWYRSFLVVNRRDRAVARANALVRHVDYGYLTFDPAATPLVPVHLRDGKVLEQAAAATPDFYLFPRPVPGTMPLFLIEDARDGRQVITTDPYVFVPSEPVKLGLPADHPQQDYYREARGYALDRHHSRWKRLLGYGYVHRPDGGGIERLSRMLPPVAMPAPDVYHLDLWAKPGSPK